MDDSIFTDCDFDTSLTSSCQSYSDTSFQQSLKSCTLAKTALRGGKFTDARIFSKIELAAGMVACFRRPHRCRVPHGGRVTGERYACLSILADHHSTTCKGSTVQRQLIAPHAMCSTMLTFTFTDHPSTWDGATRPFCGWMARR